jgi:HAE1 family hydrophobic/amphiphilic exporter-1
MLKTLLNGSKIVSLIMDDRIIDVNLNYPDKSVASIEDVQNYPVFMNDKSVPVKHFFDFERAQGVNQIRFDGGVETYNIYAFMKRDTPSYMRTSLENKVRAIVAKVKLPEGYTVSFMNTQTVVNDAVSSLVIAIIASIVLIYIVLGIEFNSLKIPLIILITIPLGLIGVIGCLYVFKSTISLNSLLGIILLGGTVVSNAIIMIDFYLKKQDATIIGNPKMLQDTIITVAGLRFRPIVITSLTAILGMLPIAFAIGDGANIIQPLGITVSGGLAVSTFFTLFMIPCILNLVKLKK